MSNCTSNIRLHIKHIGSARPWDWQLLVNGSIDEHAYELGAIDTSLPFAELKRLSHINDRARAADRDPAFSSRIRDGLPGMPRQGLDPSSKALNLPRQKMQKEIKRIPHLVGMPGLRVTP